MITCFVCHVEFEVVVELLKHFKSHHGMMHRYGTFRCAQGQCCRAFTDKYVLSKHITRDHPLDICIPMECPVAQQADDVIANDIESQDHSSFYTADMTSDCVDDMHSSNSYSSDVTRIAMEFISRCQKSTTCLTSVNEMIQFFWYSFG